MTLNKGILPLLLGNIYRNTFPLMTYVPVFRCLCLLKDSLCQLATNESYVANLTYRLTHLRAPALLQSTMYGYYGSNRLLGVFWNPRS